MTFEKMIRKHLKGDMKEAALQFAAYLNENGLTPKQWFNQDLWRVPYENHYLCGIKLFRDGWTFWFWSGDYSGDTGEEFTKFVQENVTACVDCVGEDHCKKGKDTAFFGKEFARTCIQFPLQIANPDVDTLEQIKQLLEFWKTAAPNDTSWHYRD